MTTSSPTCPTGTPTGNVNCIYAPCAIEGQQCNFTGTKAIAYLAPASSTGAIYFRNLANGMACGNATFSPSPDPAPNFGKGCYTAAIPPDILAAASGFYDANGNPAGWTNCAAQNATCNTGSSTPVDILFGAQGSYVYANATSTPCNTTVFGDPKPNVSKACWVRTPAAPSPAPSPSPAAPSPAAPPPPSVPPSPTPWISTGTWIFIGVIIFLVVLAIVGAIVYFVNKNKGTKK